MEFDIFLNAHGHSENLGWCWVFPWPLRLKGKGWKCDFKKKCVHRK